MNLFSAAVRTEFHKARRSRVPWAVAAACSIVPLVGGLFMVILKDPEAARQVGLIGAKAQLTAGVADWPTFMGLLTQAMALAGWVLFAFLTAWLFGREFADRTVRGLLAIPTSRSAIVIAKTIVIATWSLAIAAWVLVFGLAVGAAVGLPGWTPDGARDAVVTFAIVAVLVVGLQATTAFVAGAGRGFMAPLAWAILMVFCAQVLAVLGWGAWFPWAVPALVAGAAGPDGETVTTASYLLVLAATIAGFVATLAWWRRADQTG